MIRRKVLVIATISLALGGLIISAIPFISSMGLSEATKNSLRVQIKISEIPNNGVLVADYRYYTKIFAVRSPKLQIFQMPFWNGAYMLPDPTWERAFVPCRNFMINNTGFSCEDSSLHESLNRQATWDLSGKSNGTWMPDLETINFHNEGEYIVLSPEYE